MRVVHLRWVAAACLVASATPAFAQGTAEERRACGPDAMRLCREFIPNFQAVDACLNRRQAELSAACRAIVLAPAIQPAGTVRKQTTARREAEPKKKSARLERDGTPRHQRVAERERTRVKAGNRVHKTMSARGHKATREDGHRTKHEGRGKAHQVSKGHSSRHGAKSGKR